MSTYDALLIVSFGGPEGMDDVMPFLDNVLAGKNVPEERKKEVAHHYEMFGGVSPINAQNRELKILVEKKLKEKGIELPVFWGNRNWNPYIKDAVLEMKQAGVRNALAYVTSAFGSYSGCRQYVENIEVARAQIGDAPQISKLRAFFNHPTFIQIHVERIRDELKKLSSEEISNTHIAFTAHSIPTMMSAKAPYLDQLNEACRLVAQELRVSNWKLVFQSRSGPPTMPWLEPDINDHLKELAAKNVKSVIVSPIGFVSDHMEVMFDLDVEAKKTSEDLGVKMLRAKSPGNHPLFVEMIVELIQERLNTDQVRKKLGTMEACADVCAPDCCKFERPSRP